ncbi:MAG: DUF86 domain-containing protein [Candidatus Pacearchaeota archaeon]|jgi:uncharacterized protein YutE (UPF0331/DUF86 family)
MKNKEDRIKDKIIEIEKFIEELEPVLPSDFEDYRNDYKIKAIGERYFEKIIEAVVDVAFFIIKEKKLKQPEYEKQVFEILANERIISKELSERLQEAKGMRNIISHQYGKLDDAQVFHSLSEELIPDILEFIKLINELK